MKLVAVVLSFLVLIGMCAGAQYGGGGGASGGMGDSMEGGMGGGMGAGAGEQSYPVHICAARNYWEDLLFERKQIIEFAAFFEKQTHLISSKQNTVFKRQQHIPCITTENK